MGEEILKHISEMKRF